MTNSTTIADRSVGREVAPAATSAIGGNRIAALDWTKGTLVIFMVIYHGINYSRFRPLAFEYLAFLPPSFILIAGFIVGQIYTTKYDLTRGTPYLRLVVRGLKLLALFTACNVLLFVFEYRRFGLAEGLKEFLSHGDAIFLSGHGRVAIFEVLLPIAYFLLAAPALIWISRQSRWAILALTVALCGLCVRLEQTGSGSDHLILFVAGMIGFALAALPLATINRAASRWWMVLGLYVAYRMVSHHFGERFAVQMFGACATLFAIYAFALWFASNKAWYSAVVQLGQYSLFAYFFQIALLQVLVRTLTGTAATFRAVILLVTCVTVGTLLAVYLISSIRARSQPMNTAYKAVFA